MTCLVFKSCENLWNDSYITQIVQVETVWVLKCAYGFSRPDIELVPDSLHSNQAFRLENETIFASALQIYRDSNIDFSDALILQRSTQQHLKLLSFDKKLKKQLNVITP